MRVRPRLHEGAQLGVIERVEKIVYIRSNAGVHGDQGAAVDKVELILQQCEEDEQERKEGEKYDSSSSRYRAPRVMSGRLSPCYRKRVPG